MTTSHNQPPVVLVTGAGSGIGRAAAIRFAAAGAHLVLVGRRAAALDETAAMLPASARPLCIVADVGDVERVGAAIDAAAAHFGRLDVLVNNAGHAPLLPIDQTTPAMLNECFRVNTIGPALAIACAWPLFVRQNSGCVINVSSMATVDPFPGFFMYAAAKAGVNLMARSCANEGRPFNIRAFSVAPGAVETPLLRTLFSDQQLPPSRCLSADDVARVIAECASGVHDHRNGETILVPSP